MECLRAGVFIVLLLAAGCVSPDGAEVPTASTPTPVISSGGSTPSNLAAHEAAILVAPDEPTASSLDLWRLDPTEWPEGEVTVAASRTDARVALVAGHAHREEGRRVFAAVTTDAGASWRVWNATIPGSIFPYDAIEGKTFDPVAAAGADGAMHVLYIADAPSKAPVHGRPVLASTRDGVTWRVAALPGPEVLPWDYVGLAAAPDRNALFAVVNVIGAGPWFWRSDDGGESWHDPVALIPATGTPQQPPISIPDVVAGRDGVVVVSVRSGGALHVATSLDDGESFGPFLRAIPGVGGSTGRGAAARDASVKIEVFAGVGDRMRRAVAEAPGEPFGDAADLWRAEKGLVHGWIVIAPRQDDTLALAQLQGEDGKSWGIELNLLRDGARAQRLLVVPPTRVAAPREGAAGNDYGGLSVGLDNAVWASWSDVRDGSEAVGVARWRTN